MAIGSPASSSALERAPARFEIGCASGLEARGHRQPHAGDEIADSLAGFFGDVRVIINDTRYGLVRNSGLFGNITQRETARIRHDA